MDDIYQEVRSHIQIANYRMKERYDMGAEECHYAEVDLVWLYNPQKTRGLFPQLQKAR